MEQELTEIYCEAKADLTAKWNAYMERGEKRLSNLYTKYQEEGTVEAKEAYEKAVRNYTLQNDKYRDMVNETARQIANVNTAALAYANDQIPSIYTINYNSLGSEIKPLKIDFKAIDESVVKRMILDGDIKLPKKKLDIPKDMQWNTKKLNSSVLQGILQGESMDKIAKRIEPVVNNNKVSAIRNARTMVTGAENRGRLDSFKKLSDDGIVMKKIWLATGDGNTRDWHLDMDGQEVEVDEMFIDGLGNELEYPGDPSGAPETVYNCRCSMQAHVVGFRKSDGSISYVNYKEEGESEHEAEIREEKEQRHGKRS